MKRHHLAIALTLLGLSASACEFRADLRGSKYTAGYLRPTQEVQFATVGQGVDLAQHVAIADGRPAQLTFTLPQGGCASIQRGQLTATCAEPILVAAAMADDPRTTTTWTVQVRPAALTRKVVVDEPKGGASLALTPGESGQVRGSVEASDGTVTANLRYASSDTQVVAVDDGGRVQALKAGRASITLTAVEDPQAKAVVQVVVSDAAASQP